MLTKVPPCDACRGRASNGHEADGSCLVIKGISCERGHPCGEHAQKAHVKVKWIAACCFVHGSFTDLRGFDIITKASRELLGCCSGSRLCKKARDARSPKTEIESVILMILEAVVKVIQAKTQKELLLIIGVLTFVLSSVLNNLTVATWQAEAVAQ